MNAFLSIARIYKRLITVFADLFFIFIAFIAAVYTRLGTFEFLNNSAYWSVFAVVAISTVVIFMITGLYRAVLRYLSVHALIVIVFSCITSALILVISSYIFESVIPRSIPIIYCFFILLLSGGARLLIRVSVSGQKKKQKDCVLIYGAGDSGRQLLHLLRQGDDLHPVAFIDDNKSLLKTVVNGMTVFGASSIPYLINKKNITKILLAMPSVSRSERKHVIDSLVDLPVEVLSIPHFEELIDGTASIDQLRDVPIDDLLGRESVPVKPELLGANINGKVVLVTGAGGSIGSELCRQILLQNPTSLVLFELSEFALYKIDKELSKIVETNQLATKIIPLLGSVQRKNRIEKALTIFKVQTVYHAAAYKHVPLVEYNAAEGIRNNVFGTYYTALAAINAKVESFVLISTDKAVRPTNVMGTTKRMAELALQSLAAEKHDTRFCMVRFGNVLGSSGSVIPLFKRQILEQGPVTITHPDITIPEAAGLVIQAGAMGKGGDVFVLDMGKPVKIIDLATNLIKLSGLEVKSIENPLGDIEIKYTGLRPGEKLFEELLIGDDVMNSQHERIMRANESFVPYDEYKLILQKLDVACHNFDHELIRKILLSVPAGFNPTDGIGDLVWNENR